MKSKNMSKLLFILKIREDYSAITHSHVGLSTGLYNSAKFIVDMIEAELSPYSIRAKIVVVNDNNDIDREVTAYNPTHVIIEALWVVPSKLSILQELHPNVKWIVRLHSEMPFMAGEGIAMDWIGDYARFKNVFIGVNAPRMRREVITYLDNFIKNAKQKVIYLPNYYPNSFKKKNFNKKKEHIDIGCFGAIRPLKNHLTQAVAALEFAEGLGKKLRFHVNAGRIEMKGEPMLSNLRGLFQQVADRGHELHNHQWSPREQFLELCAKMDIGLQISFSETFNIVGCDLVSQGVPFIGSGEIPWLPHVYHASPTDTKEIVRVLHGVYHMPRLNVFLNKYCIRRYVAKTIRAWKAAFK